MIDQTAPSTQNSQAASGVRREPGKRRAASAYSPSSRFYRYQQRLRLDPRRRRQMAAKTALAELRESYGSLLDISGSLTVYAHPQRSCQSDAQAIASDWRSVGNSLRIAFRAMEAETTS